MIEAEPGRNAARHEPIDQAIVKIEALCRDGPGTGRQDTWPSCRETVSVETALREQIHVLAPTMIMVAGHVARVAVFHPPRRVAKNVPDALAAAVGIDRSLDLIA